MLDIQQTVKTNFSRVSSYVGSFFSPPKQRPKTQKEIKPLALNPKLGFKDGTTPIFYQENNLLVLLMMQKHENNLKPLKDSLFLEDGYLPPSDPYTGLTLVPFNDSWLIHDGVSKTFSKPLPHQSYAFVTMPDKSIRVTLGEKSVHVSLSDKSPVVRYAGNVTFDEKGEIIAWDNTSGAYRPNSELASQAGFRDSDLQKFKPFETSHNTLVI